MMRYRCFECECSNCELNGTTKCDQTDEDGINVCNGKCFRRNDKYRGNNGFLSFCPIKFNEHKWDNIELIPLNDDIKKILRDRSKGSKLLAKAFLFLPGNGMQQSRQLEIGRRKNNRKYDNKTRKWLYNRQYIYPKNGEAT